MSQEVAREDAGSVGEGLISCGCLNSILSATGESLKSFE